MSPPVRRCSRPHTGVAWSPPRRRLGPGQGGSALLGLLLCGCVAVSPGARPGPSSELGICGNGVLEPDEECDGDALGGATCEAATGAVDGVLRCTADCRLDTSGCHTCGDGLIEGPEACEAGRVGVRACRELGFEAGSPYCNGQCELAGCYTCGDGICASEDGESAYNCPADCGGWRDLALGGAHSCAVTQAGNVYCWGDNQHGQRGSSGRSGLATPEGLWRVVGLSEVERVTAGWAHTCALRADGRVLCWGSDLAGQLGAGGTDAMRLVPTLVPDLEGVVDLSAGADHTCALDLAGVVWCWGRNLFGQLGDGTTEDHRTPAPVVGLPAARAIAVGHSFSCAVAREGGAWCWGVNDVGQLGTGALVGLESRDGFSYSSRPAAVAGLAAVQDLRLGAAHACAVEQRQEGEHGVGELWCWGGNDRGQLGDGQRHQLCGALDCSPRPVIVTLPWQTTRVEVGAHHGCARLADGYVWCWGAPDEGRLGRAEPCASAGGCSPAPVTGPSVTGVRQLAVGAAHGCAVTADRSLWCWGTNASGQAGCTASTCQVPFPLVDRIVR